MLFWYQKEQFFRNSNSLKHTGFPWDFLSLLSLFSRGSFGGFSLSLSILLRNYLWGVWEVDTHQWCFFFLISVWCLPKARALKWWFFLDIAASFPSCDHVRFSRLRYRRVQANNTSAASFLRSFLHIINALRATEFPFSLCCCLLLYQYVLNYRPQAPLSWLDRQVDRLNPPPAQKSIQDIHLRRYSPV